MKQIVITIQFFIILAIFSSVAVAQEYSGSFVYPIKIKNKQTCKKYVAFHVFTKEKGLNEAFAWKLANDFSDKILENIGYSPIAEKLPETSSITFGLMPVTVKSNTTNLWKTSYETNVIAPVFEQYKNQLTGKYDNLSFEVIVNPLKAQSDNINPIKYNRSIFNDLIKSNIESLLTAKKFTITYNQNARFRLVVTPKTLETKIASDSFSITQVSIEYQIINKSDSTVLSSVTLTDDYKIIAENQTKAFTELCNAQIIQLAKNSIQLSNKTNLSLFNQFYQKIKDLKVDVDTNHNNNNNDNNDNLKTLNSKFISTTMVLLDPSDFDNFVIPNNLNELKISIEDNIGNEMKYFNKKKKNTKIRITLSQGYYFVQGRTYTFYIDDKAIDIVCQKKF